MLFYLAMNLEMLVGNCVVIFVTERTPSHAKASSKVNPSADSRLGPCPQHLGRMVHQLSSIVPFA